MNEHESRARLILIFLLVICLPCDFRAQAASEPVTTPTLLTGRVMSGELPIVGSQVTLYGAVTQCIPDPCMGINVPVAHTQTDSRGSFSIDLSKATAEADTGRAPNRAPPAPGSLYLIANGGRVVGLWRPNNVGEASCRHDGRKPARRADRAGVEQTPR